MIRVASLTLLALSGCATLINGPTQAITVDSNVVGAKVAVSSGQDGFTPTRLVVPRGQAITVSVSAEGHQPRVVALRRTLDPLTGLSCLFLSLPGLLADLVTGAGFAQPGHVVVNLLPDPRVAAHAVIARSVAFLDAPVQPWWREPGLLHPMEARPESLSPPLVRAPALPTQLERGDEPAPLY